MTNIRISTIQSTLFWENTSANLEMFDDKLDGLANMTDLVILPEMFTTGFSMDAPKLAEKMDGPTIEWLAKKASLLNAVVTGSLIISADGNYYNRCIWMRPDGTFEYYDKRHLFTMAGEDEVYTPGNVRLTTEWRGWKICPLICYDLRFPVWARNTEAYDLLIFMANWPDTRSHHWRQLLMARAIENQTYVAGVNRVGTDEKGFQYSGDSSVIDYSGQVLYQTSNVEDVFTCVLQKASMETYRQKLNFLPDQDNFEIF